ncbi:MAG TPA: hypothetical protein VIK96_05165 [Bacilli bacterium]
MAYLKIENLQLGNYSINLNIENGEVVGIYSQNKKAVLDLLEIIAGINPGESVLYNEKNVFDNREYFQNRIFLDYSHTYLSTLRVSVIEEVLKNKYNLSFNKEKFVKIGKELDIRGETEISEQYKFTSAGNTFVNFALTMALEKPNIVVNNPTSGLNLPEDIQYIVKGLTDITAFNTAIIGIDRLKVFKGRFHKILFLSDYGTVHCIAPETTLLVFPKEFEPQFPLFASDKKVISLSSYQKEELKQFQKNKIEYEMISVYDIEDYL